MEMQRHNISVRNAWAFFDDMARLANLRMALGL